MDHGSDFITFAPFFSIIVYKTKYYIIHIFSPIQINEGYFSLLVSLKSNVSIG